MNSFSSYQLPVQLVEALTKFQYSIPTEIQSQSIPAVLSGADVLASSNTGSGKTAAFVVPIIAKILENPKEVHALILAPTRELVQQISDLVRDLSNNKFGYIALYGGTSIQKQISQLKRFPNIVVATPGRLQDHMKRKNIKLETFNTFVLDEFDRMLDMGFKDEIKYISSQLPKERQTLMFSATDSEQIITLAKSYLAQNYQTIKIKQKEKSHENITQAFILTKKETRVATLLEQIDKREGSILIFTNTKLGADDLQDELQDEGLTAQAIHGDLRQEKRQRILKRFKNEKCRILIATDVVARGIDISHIKHVINYNLPRHLEDYTHRIGRTGRFTAKGEALSLVTFGDREIYQKIIAKFGLEDSLGFGTATQHRKRKFNKFGNKPTGRRKFGGNSSKRGNPGEGFKKPYRGARKPKKT